NKLPPKWQKTLNRYSTGARSISTTSDWQAVLKSYLIHIILLSLIIMGIIILISGYIKPLLFDWITGGVLGSAVAAIFCFILILPFLWSLIARKFSQTEFTNLWSNKRYRGPLLILRLVR